MSKVTKNESTNQSLPDMMAVVESVKLAARTADNSLSWSGPTVYFQIGEWWVRHETRFWRSVYALMGWSDESQTTTFISGDYNSPLSHLIAVVSPEVLNELKDLLKMKQADTMEFDNQLDAIDSMVLKNCLATIEREAEDFASGSIRPATWSEIEANKDPSN